jgi:hypothetical protein
MYSIVNTIFHISNPILKKEPLVLIRERKRELSWPQSQPECCGKDYNLLLLPGTEPSILWLSKPMSLYHSNPRSLIELDLTEIESEDVDRIQVLYDRVQWKICEYNTESLGFPRRQEFCDWPIYYQILKNEFA